LVSILINKHKTDWNLKSDGHQFHQYQQNEQSPLTENKKAMTYNVGNPNPGLQQAHICGGVKLVNGIGH
jgi:hypothetical protein